jgi:BlaI family penicillinase repressor
VLNFQHVSNEGFKVIGLSRREREILEIIHRMGEATAQEVHETMENAPTYSAVRATLRIMEEKGHVNHLLQGKRYVYTAAVPRQDAARTALDQVVKTFFGGSLEGVVRTFLSSKEQVSPDELDRLAHVIEQARKSEEESK